MNDTATERTHADMPKLIVHVDGLGLTTLVANGAGYYVHSGDPNGGPRPVWTLNGVHYTGSVHVEQPEPGKTWVVPWPNLDRHPYSDKDATHAAYKNFSVTLRTFLEKHAETTEGAAHLRAGTIASANNDALRLAGRLEEIDAHRATVAAALVQAKARCIAVEAGRPDPGYVESPESPRGI